MAKEKYRKIKFKDILNHRFQILRKEGHSYGLYFVARKGKTLIHNHDYVLLIELGGKRIKDFESKKIMSHDFDNETWFEIYPR